MDVGTKPRIDIAQKTLPGPLFQALSYLTQQPLDDCALAGGTALSGFYTAHRRSDDIDLFVKDIVSQKATILAVKSLKNHSVIFHKEQTSLHYYHANCSLNDHHFTVDVVLDENLFRVGEFYILEKMQIASLTTILKMKAATLVSRASEKDFSDLIQLFAIFPNLTIEEFIRLGQSIDAGVHAESMLASVGGATLREDACDFSLNSKKMKKDTYKEIKDFQKKMISSLLNYLKNKKSPPLGELIKFARKVLK